jgi:hypothetical protein
MATVTFSSGNTYADNQGEAPRYLSNGGHRTWFLPLLQDFVADAGRILVTNSSTAYTLGSATGSLTMAAPIPYAVGSFVTIADNAAPTTNYALAQVTSVSGTTLNFNEIRVEGAGNINDWSISISGGVGPTGATGGVNGGSLIGNLDMDGNILTVDLVRAEQGGEHRPSATVAPAAVSGAQGLTLINFGSNWMAANGDVTLTVTAGTSAGYLLDGATFTFEQDGVTGGWDLTIVGATAVGNLPTFTGQAAGTKTQLTFWSGDDGTLLYSVVVEGY